MEPAVLVDDLGRGLWHREVTAHDVAAPLEDLAVLGDLHLDARERPSDRAELVLAGEVHARHGDRFRQAVPLEDVEAQQVEEVGDLARERRAARDERVDAAAEPLRQLVFDLRKDQPLRERERDGGVALPLLLRLRVELELAHRHAEQRAGEAGLRHPVRDHVVERLLVHARHRGEHGGARLAGVVHQPIHRLRVDHLQPAAEPGRLDDLREGVRERQE